MASNFVEVSFIARPNCALSIKGMFSVVASIALLSLVIAFVFTMAGAWLVLPFAGLELIAVAYAFYFIHQHAQDYESIVINETHLAIEKHDIHSHRQIVIQRYWAQVQLRNRPDGEQALFVRSHGARAPLHEQRATPGTRPPTTASHSIWSLIQWEQAWQGYA